MKSLIDCYRRYLGFNDYYDIVKSRSIESFSGNKDFSKEFISNPQFLSGINPPQVSLKPEPIDTPAGTIRIDVPTWFGDMNSASCKCIVYGREPRGTADAFNVETFGDNIYASPFGCDRWNYKSSIPRKPQNKYYRAFEYLISRKNMFVLFSDIIKYYNVVSENKNENDAATEPHIKIKDRKNQALLSEEIDIVDPDIIFALGRQAYSILTSLIDRKNIVEIRHPSHGGESIANKQIMSKLNEIEIM